MFRDAQGGTCKLQYQNKRTSDWDGARPQRESTVKGSQTKKQNKQDKREWQEGCGERKKGQNARMQKPIKHTHVGLWGPPGDAQENVPTVGPKSVAQTTVHVVERANVDVYAVYEPHVDALVEVFAGRKVK